MGSTSDWDIMSAAVEMLEELGIEYEKRVISAHRTPELMFEYAKTAKERGIGVIIAGAGGAAHVAGVTAALTTVPVIGVPIKSQTLNGLDSLLSIVQMGTSVMGGMDSLLSIVQMPGGIPVSTVAINGAKNAALIAASIFALHDKDLEARLEAFRRKQTEKV